MCPAVNNNVNQPSTDDQAAQRFWDAARRKGLPTPGGPSSRIDPACLLAALPAVANSANLFISMVATSAHQTGLSWHHCRNHDDRDHLANRSERFFPVVTVYSPPKFTVWHNKNMPVEQWGPVSHHSSIHKQILSCVSLSWELTVMISRN